MRKAKSIKYSLRADRMLAVEQAIQKLIELKDRGILKVGQVWDELPTDEKYLIKTESIDSREDDKRVWEVVGKGVTVNTNPIYALSFLEKLHDAFGDRVKIAKSLNSNDYKSISHSFRVGYQLLNLYKFGDFTFPLPESEFIKDVKYGRKDFLKDDIDYKLNSLISEVETLSEKSCFLVKLIQSGWII